MPLADAAFVDSGGRPDHAALIEFGPSLEVVVSPSYIQGFERPEASHELVRKARDVLNEARIAADRAAAAHYKSAQRTKDGCHIADIAGWAHLVVHGGQTPLVSALFELDAIYPVAGEGYYFREIGGLGWNGCCIPRSFVTDFSVCF